MRGLSTGLALLSWLLTSTQPAFAQLLVGYGNEPYGPMCAEGCLRAFKPYLLACSTPGVIGNFFDPFSGPTKPACRANDTAYLTSVAWCWQAKCAPEGIDPIDLERFWTTAITGTETVPAKWTWSVALANVDPQPPAFTMTALDKQLNRTSLVLERNYIIQINAASQLYDEEKFQSKYGIILISIALGLPLVLTWIRYLPFTEKIRDFIKPYLIYPSLIGRYQVRPLPYLLGNAPTVGQALYILVFFALNLVLASINFSSRQPQLFYQDVVTETDAYVTTRTGALAFTCLPILLLFSARNNLLIWFSNWSHSTFLLLHRWVARVFMLHVIVHSILGLKVYASFAKDEWWTWGIVATIATVLLVVGSGLYIRRPQYELFLISHILLAVFVIAGSWYHLFGWYEITGRSIGPNTLGYELWLYFAIAVWFLDRLLRIGRILRSGVFRRAKLTEIGEGYVRVDVPGVRWGSEPGRHVYAYFPTVKPLRPWENHPFSVIPTQVLNGHNATANGERGSLSKDEEKQDGVVGVTDVARNGGRVDGVGITLLVRKSEGLTKHLASHDGLITLLDGPYSSGPTKEVLRCDRVLLIAGGIGITGVLPWAYSHWNVKLAWSVSESASGLANALDLSRVASREVRVGRRFDVTDLIAQEEASGWGKVGVVVCGPGGLCDDVRAAVAAAGRRGKAVFELEVDAYSW